MSFKSGFESRESQFNTAGGSESGARQCWTNVWCPSKWQAQ